MNPNTLFWPSQLFMFSLIYDACPSYVYAVLLHGHYYIIHSLFQIHIILKLTVIDDCQFHQIDVSAFIAQQ